LEGHSGQRLHDNLASHLLAEIAGDRVRFVLAGPEQIRFAAGELVPPAFPV